MQYDSNTGNITGKSDAGTLLYENSEKPYALTGVDPSTGLVPEADQALTYTSFGSVHTISEDGDSAVFVYNSDGERIKMILLHNGSHEVTRWYSGSSFMKDSVSGTARSFTYIGGDAYSAPAVARKQGSSVTYYYLLRDHLGSITHIVDSTGSSVTAEYSYDSWGRMRNPQTWENYSPGSEPVLFSGRGFTGHEHLPWFNLVNMNGRVYDPLTGGFLSPDSYIQSADLTQNYNRFTYCLNNPLIYIDPSGYKKRHRDNNDCNNSGDGETFFGRLWANLNLWLQRLDDLSDDGVSSPSAYSFYSQWSDISFNDNSGPSVEWVGGGYSIDISPEISESSNQQNSDYLMFTGKKLTWYNGDGRLIAAFNAVSGKLKHQSKSHQYEPWMGPIPEGGYSINLSLNPDRVAAIYQTYELYNNVGIERIPVNFPLRSAWGYYRARLEPLPETNTFGRINFYLHDSSKGQTSGCIEVEHRFFLRLLEYRKNNSYIELYVIY
jgi:RHS repeat-associated protein